MNIFKTLATAAVLVVGVVASQAELNYYNDSLIGTNFVFSGSTNPVPANYSPSLPDGWMSTKAVTVNDQDATGITLQVAGYQTNNVNTSTQYATNLLATVALLLDDESKTLKLPPATNSQFTASFSVPANGNLNTMTAFLAATNFQGAKWFKVINWNYQGTNTFVMRSGRGGLWVRTGN